MNERDDLIESIIPNARWNYEPAEARLCTLVVGKSLRETWWCAPLEGQQREAVEVSYGDQKFYLDNGPDPTTGEADESGVAKVTAGRGGPHWGHRSLPVQRVVEYLSFEATFGKRRCEYLAALAKPDDRA